MAAPWKVTKRGMFSKPVVTEYQNGHDGKAKYQKVIDEADVLGFEVYRGAGRLGGEPFIRILHKGYIHFKPSGGKDKNIRYIFQTYHSTDYLYAPNRPGEHNDYEGKVLADIVLTALAALESRYNGGLSKQGHRTLQKGVSDGASSRKKRPKQGVRKRHAVVAKKVRTTASNT